MSFHELLEWLEIADLSDYTPEQIGDAMDSGLDDADAYGPEVAQELAEIQDSCFRGDVPAARIAAMVARQTQSRVDAEPVGVRLERELREAANNLPESVWRTGNYLRVEEGVALAKAGNAEPLEDVLDEMRQVLIEAWAPYLQMPISHEEITAESVVGHRLLVEGFRGWTSGLDLLESALDGEIPWETALARVEESNRKLLVLDHLSAPTLSMD
jgi:hypothetical protein